MDLILYVILGIIGGYVLIKIFGFLKKKGFFKLFKVKFNEKKKKEPKKKQEKAPEVKNVASVQIVEKYMYRREVKALIALNKVLPKEFIALPKVGVANLVEPNGVRNLYNQIKDYFVDFVIFEEATMKPKLIVDIYDNSFEDELLSTRHPDLVEVFKSLKIKIVEIAVRGEIDLAVLQEIIHKNLGILPQKKQES